jgi:protein-disulfide isomerase
MVAFGSYRSASTPQVDDLANVSDANIAGLREAPVSIVEFSDFDCPSCRAWHNSGIEPQLFAEFGDQISFTFRHYPVITRQSPQAAEAAQCAGEQGAFWEYHHFLYESAPPGALSTTQLKGYAMTLGLDRAAFDRCLDGGETASYVARDREAAMAAGLRGTPAFFVNGERVSFASYEEMAAAIRAQLDS